MNSQISTASYNLKLKLDRLAGLLSKNLETEIMFQEIKIELCDLEILYTKHAMQVKEDFRNQILNLIEGKKIK